MKIHRRSTKNPMFFLEGSCQRWPELNTCYWHRRGRSMSQEKPKPPRTSWHPFLAVVGSSCITAGFPFPRTYRQYHRLWFFFPTLLNLTLSIKSDLRAWALCTSSYKQVVREHAALTSTLQDRYC